MLVGVFRWNGERRRNRERWHGDPDNRLAFTLVGRSRDLRHQTRILEVSGTNGTNGTILSIQKLTLQLRPEPEVER